jgi:hypothetical protein
LKRELPGAWRDCLSLRVRSAEIVAIDGDCNAKFSSCYCHADHDPWLVWLDFDCCVDRKCGHGRQTPHPTPQDLREQNNRECRCVSRGNPECIRGRSERLWHDQSLAAVRNAARRLAPERKRRLTPAQIFGAGRLAVREADRAEFFIGWAHWRDPVADRRHGADGGFFVAQTKRPQGASDWGRSESTRSGAGAGAIGYPS